MADGLTRYGIHHRVICNGVACSEDELATGLIDFFQGRPQNSTGPVTAIIQAHGGADQFGDHRVQMSSGQGESLRYTRDLLQLVLGTGTGTAVGTSVPTILRLISGTGIPTSRQSLVLVWYETT